MENIITLIKGKKTPYFSKQNRLHLACWVAAGDREEEGEEGGQDKVLMSWGC